MITYLYEKDLRRMKFNILTSTWHDLAVRQIARRLSIDLQRLRLIMIQRFDMSLLENLPARWEAGLRHADTNDPTARELGCELFSRFIPFVEPDEMQTICSETRAEIDNGTPEVQAIDAGKARIREVILS